MGDFARQMRRRDVVYRRPTPWWQNGLTIGNGDVGGAVYGGGPESDGLVCVALTKVDVWDARYDRMGRRVHTLEELRRLVTENAGTEEGRRRLNALEPYGLVVGYNWFKESYPYPYAPPTPKPLGVVRLDPGGVFDRCESRLSLHRAEVAFRLGTEEAGAEARVFVDAHSNVLVVHVEGRGAAERPLAFEIARYIDAQLGEPEVAAEAGALHLRYAFPDGFSYAAHGVVAGQVDSATAAAGEWRDVEALTGWTASGEMEVTEREIAAPELTARTTLAPGERAATLFLGIATSKEAPDPAAHARELAEAAARRGYDALRAEHCVWWHSFWRRSSLLVSDRMVEALWYQGLYVLACESRAAVPPPIVGPGYQLPHGGWHGALITNYNVEMLYWPAFTANHLDLVRPLWDFFHAHMETMATETRTVYGIDGVRFPCITDLTCTELSYLPCHNWQCVSAWMAQLYWWGWLYGGDEDFLRTRAYPVLREVARFYRAYAQMGEDGRYHVFPSTPPEQEPWWATDPAIDMTLIRVHMRAAIEASERLGVDEDLRAGWRDLLDNLAEIPTDGSVILDHRDAAPDRRLGHTALMCATWTGGLIGVDSPPEDYQLALRTFRTLPERTSRGVRGYPFPMPTWNDDCCWPNMIGYAARLGLAGEARRYLYDYGILQHLKPDGTFAFDCPLTDQQRETRWGMPDSGTAMTAVVSEMLLQSYDGVLRIGPAWPREWDVRFEGLLAVGAFEVSGQIVGGEVENVVVRSLRGGECRLRSPWAGAVEVTCDGRPVAHREEDSLVVFDTSPGATCTVGPQDAPVWTPPDGDGPIAYRGPAHMCEVPDERRIDVYLGLPPPEEV